GYAAPGPRAGRGEGAPPPPGAPQPASLPALRGGRGGGFRSPMRAAHGRDAVGGRAPRRSGGARPPARHPPGTGTSRGNTLLPPDRRPGAAPLPARALGT